MNNKNFAIFPAPTGTEMIKEQKYFSYFRVLNFDFKNKKVLFLDNQNNPVEVKYQCDSFNPLEILSTLRGLTDCKFLKNEVEELYGEYFENGGK